MFALHEGRNKYHSSPNLSSQHSNVMMRGIVSVAALLASPVTAYTDIRHTRFMVKNIDPIVVPGRYKSHMHSFFGSDAVTKDLPTTAELQKGCPSGENPNDLSVYCAKSNCEPVLRLAIKLT